MLGSDAGRHLCAGGGGAGTPLASFAYGVGGARVREETAVGLREFAYGPDGFLPWVTTDASGNADDLLVGGSPLLTLEPTAGPAPLLWDAAGNPMLRTNAAGEPLHSATCAGRGLSRLPCGLCFAAGTPVVTPDGLAPIESLAVGDLVLAYDPDADAFAWQPVVEVFVTPDRPVLEVVLLPPGDDAAPEIPVATPDHPFFTAELGWAPASDLRAGMRVLSADGTWLRVGAGTWLADRRTVFNVEVADFHTYFAGTAAALVHNPPCGGLGKARPGDGSVRFLRWCRGDAIDKPMPNGSAPSWGTVRSRYWKNRAEAAPPGEFGQRSLDRMYDGRAPQDYNPRTGKMESRELHHVKARSQGGTDDPMNLRELTPDWHGEVDAWRHTRPTIRGAL